MQTFLILLNDTLKYFKYPYLVNVGFRMLLFLLAAAYECLTTCENILLIDNIHDIIN